MKQQRYRVRYRYRDYHPGAEVELTEDEAIRLNNEAPGVVEHVGPVLVKQPAPKAKDEDDRSVLPNRGG